MIKSTITDIKTLLSYKAVAKIMLSRIISRFGDSLDVIAFSWLVYELTGSALMLGGIYAANILPNLLLSPFVGPLVNYLPKKLVVVLGDLLRGIFVLSAALLFSIGLLESYHLFIFTVLNSTVEVFVMPVKASVNQKLIPEDLYAVANGSMGSIIGLSQLLGYGSAGFIIATLGIKGAMIIDATTFLISGVIISTILFPKSKKQEFTTSNYFEDLKKGYSFITKDSILVKIIIQFCLMNFLFVPINAMMPLYVTEVLSSGPEIIGILSVALTMGAVCGGFISTNLSKKVNVYKLYIIPMMIISTIFFFVALPNFISSKYIILIPILSFFTVGLAFSVVNMVVQTYQMKRTPNTMIGHVSSLTSVLAMIAMPIGGSFYGLITGKMGFANILLMNSAVLFVVVMIFSLSRDVRGLKKYKTINDITMYEAVQELDVA
ncbi:MAG: MFS transporter [Clostridiales bacterium]|nr:MFS transporter [Clostridiales bacterium]